jgi:pilus assembly protein CpaB
MRLRAILVLIMGLMLAGGSVYVVNSWLADAVRQARDVPDDMPVVEFVQIVVARSDMPFGQTLEPELVQLHPWPRDALPEGPFTDLEGLLGDGKQGPRRVRRAITTGEPLTAAKVSNFGEKVTVADAIEPRMRAIAIRVNDVTGVAGFITPGDRVDILLTRELDSHEMRTDTILQNVIVRGIDQKVDENREQPAVVKTVTVEVTPEDAQKLVLAQQAGTLSLSLRNLANNEKTPLPPLGIRDLVPEVRAPAPPPAAARPRRPEVTINRGTTRASVEVRG